MSNTESGRYVPAITAFRNFVSRDPASKFPAEKGRYALYVMPGCPWAHRNVVLRTLKGLEDIIDLYLLGFGDEGWAFTGEGPAYPDKDPLHGFKTLRELYLHVNPNYTGRASVPVLFDKKTDTIVNNESAEIIRMLSTEFDDLLPEHLRESAKPGGGLYPKPLRAAIDEMNAWVHDAVSMGVYKVGFATSQAAYDENVRPLFSSLDRLEALLSDDPAKPYLFGEHLTEADLRLFTTVARFDVAYNPIMNCNYKSIRHDYPRLHLWFRRLYWDRDEAGPHRAAFYKTTEPFIATYCPGYARARYNQYFKGAAVPLIQPIGPAVLVEPLP